METTKKQATPKNWFWKYVRGPLLRLLIGDMAVVANVEIEGVLHTDRESWFQNVGHRSSGGGRQ